MARVRIGSTFGFSVKIHAATPGSQARPPQIAISKEWGGASRTLAFCGGLQRATTRLLGGRMMLRIDQCPKHHDIRCNLAFSSSEHRMMHHYTGGQYECCSNIMFIIRLGIN